jgi:hypothetical protein
MQKFDTKNLKKGENGEIINEIKDESVIDNQIHMNKEVKKRKIDRELLKKHMEQITLCINNFV